ncbi:MAG: RHS repeat-associated core domain-containing protein, partial [bacterium]|nr:RHS repeat-associated core domain-containing protein [bacterium]
MQYDEDTTTGDFRVRRMLYTLGNGRSADHAKGVEFIYEGRPDYSDIQSYGAPIKRTQRLSRIDIYAGASLFFSYQLAYEQSEDSGYSRLNRVSEFGSDGLSLLRTHQFTWRDATLTGTSVPSDQNGVWGVSQAEWAIDASQLHFADFNGDGRRDLLLQPKGNGKAKLLLANQNGSFDNAKNITNSYGMNNAAWNRSNHLVHVVDYNQDSFDDLLLQGLNQDQSTLYLEADGQGGFKSAVDIASQLGLSNAALSGDSVTWALGDYNGDGMLDFYLMPIFMHQPGFMLNGKTGGGFTKADRNNSSWGLPQMATPDVTVAPTPNFRVQRIDLNRDGRPDLLFVPYNELYETYLSLSTPTGYQGLTVVTNAYGLNKSHWNSANYTLLTRDLDADGLDDLIFLPKNTSLAPIWARQNGQGFDNAASLSNKWGISADKWATDNFSLRWLNTKGAGRLDLYFLSKDAAQPSFVAKAAASGGYQTPQSLDGVLGFSRADWSEAQSLMSSLDLNADGNIDLLLRGKTGGDATKLWMSTAGKRDALVALDNGAGGSMQLAYQSTLDHPGAVVPGAAAGPGQADTAFRYLVTKVTQTNGRGMSLSRQYQYQNARYLPGDRSQTKNLGFASKTTHVDPLGVSKTEYFRQDVPFHGLPSRSESRDHLGRLLSVDSYQWDRAQHYPEVFSIHQTSREQKVYEGGTLYKTSTSQSTFGAYDSVIERIDCIDTDCRRTKMSYHDDLSNWILRQPTESMEYAGSLVVSGSRFQYSGNQITAIESFFCPESTQCTTASGVWVPKTQGMTYDTSGNLIALEDAKGNRSVLEYDPIYNAYLTSGINALGQRSVREYNAAGQLLVLRDANQNETSYSYDVFGRLTQVNRPDGSYSTKSYSALGDPNTQWTLQRTTSSKPGAPLQMAERTEYFDGFSEVYRTIQSGDQGRLIVAEKERVLQFGGSIEKKSLPHFQGDPVLWGQTTRDLAERPLSILRPDGKTITYAYGLGQVTMTNAKGQKETRLYDRRGRLVEVKDKAGRSLFYGYDLKGNVTRIDLPNGQQVLQNFDNFGQLRQMQDPSVGLVSYDYDRNGNKVGVTDNMGRTLRFEFDELNRITRRISADGEVTSFTYDDSAMPNSLGRLSKVVDPARTIEFAYDSMGRKSAEAVQFGALPAVFTRNWSYDLAGRAISESFPKFGPAPATVQSYDYTPGGNLFQVKVDGQVYAQYDGFSAYGQPSTRTLEPGQTSEVVSRFSFDQRGLLTNMSVTNARGLELQNLSYGFDVLGNVSRIDDFTRYGEEDDDHDHDQGHHYGQEKDHYEREHKESKKSDEHGKSEDHDREKDRDHILSTGISLSQSQIFEYDPLGQLIRATGAYGDKTYAYDQIGNMTHIGAAVDRDFTYNGTQLIAGTRTEVTYDGSGAMTGKLQDGLEWGYRYNALGHMTEVYKNGGLLQANAYDYKGQRILQRVYRGHHNHKVHTTFYPAAGVQVKHDHEGNKFVITKTISAGSYGKLASFDEHYAFGETDEAGQWVAYSQIFDQNTPKGFALAVGYRFLAKITEPQFLVNLPYTFFGLLSLAVLMALLWSQLKNWRNETQETSRFGWGNRLVSLSMVFMMFWVASCGNGNQGNGDPLSIGDSTTLSGETLDVDVDDDQGTEGTSEDLSAPARALSSGNLLGQMVQTRPMTDKVFFHPNHIQTATLITDSEGQVAARIRHLPYGEVDVQSTLDHRKAAKQYASFTGQELDESTGLIYYNARYYDPSLGRFISPDTLIDGDGTGAVHFNRYAYVRNNPTNFTDPTGHAVHKVTLGASSWSAGTAWALTDGQYGSWMQLPHR